MWKLWLKDVKGLENLSIDRPSIIVSNHLSYYDFFVLASVLERQTIFIASQKLKQTPFVGWFMKLDTIVYVDVNKPGYSFFKQLYQFIGVKKHIVIYPEGTRSRSGRMQIPKSGFIKLAQKANLPIIPVAMKGTYEILPPQKHLPKLKRCEVIIGKPINVSSMEDLSSTSGESVKRRQLMAIMIMNQVREMANQEWDESALPIIKQYQVLGAKI